MWLHGWMQLLLVLLRAAICQSSDDNGMLDSAGLDQLLETGVGPTESQVGPTEDNGLPDSEESEQPQTSQVGPTESQVLSGNGLLNSAGLAHLQANQVGPTESQVGATFKAVDALSTDGWTNAGSPDLLIKQEGASVNVFGTKFTAWNYFTLQASLLAACGASDMMCQMWYSSLTKTGDPYVAYGPGPNTVQYYGWIQCKALLESYAPMSIAGTMQRYNELGLQIFNSVMWPETKTIALGYTTKWHQFVRPFLAANGDKGRKEGGTCDGSTCWNLAYLKGEFRRFLASMDSFTAGDQAWMIAIILAKIYANLDWDEKKAKELIAFQVPSIAPAPLPPNVANKLNVKMLQEKRIKFLDEVKVALYEKYKDQNFTPEQLTVLSSSFLDTLLYAGGLSVPTAITYMMGLYYTRLPGWIPWVVLKGEVDLEDTEGLYNWMYEVLRRYPPVAGVPRWVKKDTGDTWHHEIPNVAQALNDARVFENPSRIELGRQGLNYKDTLYSIGWADFALQDGDTAKPNSHACPGKELSKLIIQAFFEEYLDAGPWSAALPFLIYYNTYKVLPPFTVCKHEHFGHCHLQRFLFALFLIFMCCVCPVCCCGICTYGCHKAIKASRDKLSVQDEEEELLNTAG